MLLVDVLEGVNIISQSADMQLGISGITHDSREVKPGYLFVAIRGFESDGHNYVADAVGNGAVCVLCESAPGSDVPYVTTRDTRRALAIAAANLYLRPAQELKIIGVTGTNGKTTVTTLIKDVLESVTAKPVGLIGTNRNMIGERVIPAERTTPESTELHALLREMVSAGCEYAVMEVSSHALTLERVYGITFEVGVFTNLTRDHLDFHADMDEYGAAKAALFTQCKTGVLNLDDEYFPLMTEDSTCDVVTFAVTHEDADLVAKRVQLAPGHVTFCALETGRLQKVELHIPGLFSVYNALAAIETCRVLGVGLEEISNALYECPGVVGRAEVVPTGGDFTVIIDYAHTPDALTNIITAVREGTKGRVVTLFGCGGDRDKTKRPLMGAIAASLSDFVFVTSDNPRTEPPETIIAEILAGMGDTQTPYTVIVNRREAIRHAIASLRPDDTLILAGKGHETYQIIGKEKTHFDEREEVRAALEAADKRV